MRKRITQITAEQQRRGSEGRSENMVKKILNIGEWCCLPWQMPCESDSGVNSSLALQTSSGSDLMKVTDTIKHRRHGCTEKIENAWVYMCRGKKADKWGFCNSVGTPQYHL